MRPSPAASGGRENDFCVTTSGCRTICAGAGDVATSRSTALSIIRLLSGVMLGSRSVMKVEVRVTGVALGVFGMWMTICVIEGCS